MNEYDEFDATGLAALVAAGDVTSRELVEAAIHRAEVRNPHINAISSQRFEQALAEADRPPSGPFAGVPIMLKDIGAHMAGEPHQFGAKVVRDAGHVFSVDSFIGQRFRRAGFVNLGRTTTPEFAVSIVTESAATGITRNPWDPDRITGGSSGGAAAVVAARIVPIAHGNDGAGSIRMPASITGTVGLKSTRARVSNGPLLGEVWAGLAHEGAITRTVRDAAGVLDAISGNAPGDPYFCPEPKRPFANEVGVDPGRLRIGVLTGLAGFEVHSDCVRAVERTAAQLAELGHHVEYASPPALSSWFKLLPTFLDLLSAHVVAEVGLIRDLLARPVALEEFEPLTQHYFQRARGMSAADYVGHVEQLQTFGRSVASWWSAEGVDLLLTPTVAGPPAHIGDLDFREDDAERSLTEQYRYFPFTPAFNISGQPGISLPLQRNGDGLPIGIQLVADSLREDILIRVASQLEAAHPWRDARPEWVVPV